MNSRPANCLVVFVVVLFAFLCFWRLGFPPEKYFDEVYHVTTAQEFLGLRGFTDTAHPPYGKIFSAFILMLLGDYPWTWRLSSVFCGIGSLIAVFFLSKKLTNDSLTALFAAALFAFDGVSLVMARTGIIHAQMLFFMLLSLLAMFPYAVDGARVRPQSFLASGILFGLAFATRWMAVGILGVLILMISWRWREEKEKSRVGVDFLLCFALAALFSYAAAYTILPVMGKYQWFDVLRHQGHMMEYHVRLKAGHPYASKWWGWPLLLRPIWYYLQRSQGLVYGILCMGNPAVFWAIPPAMGFACWDFFRRRSRIAAFVLVGFLVQWLPYVFIERVTFFHYIYPMLPFQALAIAYLLRKIEKIGTVGRLAAWGYLAFVIGMFFYWYPLLTAYPVSEALFRQHLWFRSWV